MRHRKAGTRLNRTTSHRKAMLRNMVTSLFEHERITTTEAKAKTLKPLADKMITLAKRGDLHARRQALAVIRKKSVTQKLFGEIKGRYIERPGGYTTLVKLGPRRGDGAPLTVVELVKPEEKSKKKKSKKKAAGKASTSKKKAAATEGTAKAAKAAPDAAPTDAAPAEPPAEETSQGKDRDSEDNA